MKSSPLQGSFCKTGSQMSMLSGCDNAFQSFPQEYPVSGTPCPDVLDIPCSSLTFIPVLHTLPQRTQICLNIQIRFFLPYLWVKLMLQREAFHSSSILQCISKRYPSFRSVVVQLILRTENIQQVCISKNTLAVKILKHLCTDW